MLALAGVSPAMAETANPIRVLVDGVPVQLAAEPAMLDGRVFVPAGGLLAALGAAVAETREAGVLKVAAEWKGRTIEIRGNWKTALVNGRPSDLGSLPKTISGTLYVPVRWLGEQLGARVHWLSATQTVTLTFSNEELPRVGTFDHLRALVGEAAQRGSSVAGRYEAVAIQIDAMPATGFPSIMSKAGSASTAGGDYSRTNTQVSGVDEADMIKTDGTYLYQVSGNRVVIIRAVPADAMEVAAEIPFGDGFRPVELYAEPGRLIVIGASVKPDVRKPHQAKPMPNGPQSVDGFIYPVEPVMFTTSAYVYDTEDAASPRLVRELELEGDYLSSRKIGDNLYLVSNKWLDVYRIMEGELPPDRAVPLVRDAKHAAEKAGPRDNGSDAGEGAFTPVPLDDIRYFPDFIDPNYLLIGAVNLADNADMDVQVYLGSGQNVYASQDHLYTAVSRYEQSQTADAGLSGVRVLLPRMAETSTDIYKFALLPGKVEFRAKGNVPGSVLNQFSMDEYDGHFRIATTTGFAWGTGDMQSKNHLFVLDDQLKPAGKVTDIAPGEQIYSVRFMGKRAYMVTFRTVDPLFAIDLSDPASPKVLGALKIPGYSNYLHPYDENHVIGFGKDTVEVSWKDENGNVIDTNAYYLGMKVSLFDVTDVKNPIEKHVEFIGDRGTYSDLLTNHKALLFSREKDNLLAFPVDLYEDLSKHQSRKPPRDPGDAIPDFGTFTYQGAYVYRLDPERGFELRGRITHLDEDELLKAGQFWHNGDRFIRRILYIGDTLYTVSDTTVKANALDDLREIGVLHLKKTEK
jgi:hypothetical protein